jgi:hypothetical protein
MIVLFIGNSEMRSPRRIEKSDVDFGIKLDNRKNIATIGGNFIDRLHVKEWYRDTPGISSCIRTLSRKENQYSWLSIFQPLAPDKQFNVCCRYYIHRSTFKITKVIYLSASSLKLLTIICKQTIFMSAGSIGSENK